MSPKCQETASQEPNGRLKIAQLNSYCGKCRQHSGWDQMERPAFEVAQRCKGRRPREAGRVVNAQVRRRRTCCERVASDVTAVRNYTLSTKADCRVSDDRRFFWSLFPCLASASSCSSGLGAANVPGLRISKPELTLRSTWSLLR